MGDVSMSVFVLRLLGDEEVGNQALTPYEREQLRIAADELARLQDELVAMTAERDRLQVGRVEEANHG